MDTSSGLQTFAEFYNSLSPEELAKICNTACHPQLQANPSTQTQQQVAIATPSSNNKQWGCNLKDKTPNVAGSLIESAIWNLFSTAFGTSNTSHQSPPIPKAHRSGDGRNGEPDLVLWLNRIYNNNSLPVDIYEVKPITYNPTSTGNSTLNAQGRAQLARYVNNFWRTGLATSANAGTTWNPAGTRFPSPIDSSQDVILYTYYPSQSSENGMIYYACEDR